MTGRQALPRTTLGALAAALLAVGGYSACAQAAAPDPAYVAAQTGYIDALAAKDGWKTLDGGVKWRRLAGDGRGPRPAVSDTVTVRYEGRFTDGRMFDGNWNADQPATFPLARLVQGWQTAIPQMGVGDTIQIAVPAAQGYGMSDKGPIPGGSTLVFVIRLIAIGDAPQ